MIAHCEKEDGSYEDVKMEESPVCGEGFCDKCGDCLVCYECPCRFWVIYKESSKNPFKNNE